MRTSSRLGAITACTLWASAFVGVKFGLGFMPAFTFAGIRFLLAGLMQVPFAHERRDPMRQLGRGAAWWVGLFNTFLLYALFFKALEYARGAQAAIVIGASPLIAGWMAHHLMPNDRMDRRQSLAIAIGMAGVAIIAVASKPWDPVGLRETAGLGMLLMASTVSVYGNILVARTRGRVRPVSLNSAQMMAGGSMLLLLGLATEGVPELRLPPAFWGTLVYLAALSAFAFGIWFFLLQREKVSRLNLWKFLVPVLGAGFSWGFLPDESPDVPSLVGMVLVAAAIVVGTRERRPAGRS